MNKDSKREILAEILEMCLKQQNIQMLEKIQPDVEHLLLHSLVLATKNRHEECLQTLQAVIDVTWESLNTGHWSLVPESERAIYAAASLLKVVALVRQSSALPDDSEESISCLQQAVRQADLGLLLGNAYRRQLTTAGKLLSQAISEDELNNDPNKPEQECSKVSEVGLGVASTPVSVLHCPSLETFSSQHFHPRKPVKLTGCMLHWPAMNRWSTAYLARVAGARTVPVELGARYSDSDWSQRLMPLAEFILQHVNAAAGDQRPIGYLAQHPLFDQVPELKSDIVVPDYCACSDEQEEEEAGEGEVDINAWFGPAGTVSPLHHDPKHNLLCQVVGRKRVVLYSPSESDKLYPHEGRMLSNTAQVDPEDPNYSAYPMYRHTNAFSCVLQPGEMLYIPPTWWHHVRAFELSFSVSFWWK